MFRIVWLAGIFLAVVLAAVAVKMWPIASPELGTATIARATADAESSDIWVRYRTWHLEQG
jgi:hypothetical protein